jgi:ABC-type Fe3+-hydroxamate transport system substrate-binding protein
MPPVEIIDDRGDPLRLPRPPQRIVSLVPSDTYTLLALGAGDRLVGRTKYCVEPAPEVDRIPAVGGTKNPDLDMVMSLEPELVIANQEENSRADIVHLRDRGARVLLTFPKRLADGLMQVGRLGRVIHDLDDRARLRVKAAYDALREAQAVAKGLEKVPTFVPIWMDPLMTINDDTFIADVLTHIGARNVFGDRARRYPLAADIGDAKPLAGKRVEGRDTRYPRVTLEEVKERAPRLVLLPDEPHPFSEADAEVFRPMAERVHLCNGKALMWPGLMSLERLGELRGLVAPSGSER